MSVFVDKCYFGDDQKGYEVIECHSNFHKNKACKKVVCHSGKTAGNRIIENGKTIGDKVGNGWYLLKFILIIIFYIVKTTFSKIKEILKKLKKRVQYFI
jgi:hypothetical protein